MTDEVTLVSQSRVWLAPYPFYIIGNFVSYDINPPGDAHANAEEICRLCNAFAVQNLAKRDTFLFIKLKENILLKEYLKAQSRTNEAIAGDIFSSDELDRFSKSDFRWADRRGQSFRQRPVRKGEIYQFEFGKNYIPEMSYEHRGLVIGVKQKLLYVLPIFSYNPDKHQDVFHPVDYPNSKSDMFLLKSSEFSFISHDSVLKLNDIKTVSINRILYQQRGRIAPDSDTYKQIEKLTLQKYFPSFSYDYAQNIKTVEELNEQLNEAIEDKKTIETENERLKAEIESLKKQLEAIKRTDI